MEDIYGDLENYNDVNVVEELRNENKELKCKLEEYASSMETLQMDFDRIVSEFKTMEINYSSLLRTARAEIERKTQIISKLNIEKDLMVLNSIQNSNKNILNIRKNMARDRTSNFKKNRRDFEADVGKTTKSSNNSQEFKKFDSEKERNEENRLFSVDTISSGHTDDTNKLSNMETKPLKVPSYIDTGRECKENVVNIKSRAQSIRNRRKSMPVISKQSAKFSSDEEYEGNYSSEEVKKLPKEDKNRRPPDRLYNDKYRHKISETSGFDEKYSSYHESSRETYYRGKHSRYSDKYRSTRGRYDPSQRHRRHFSPDRTHRKSREYFDEHYQRPDYGRHRVLESPPNERYDSRRNRSRELRPNYEKEHLYDERHKHRNEKYAVKHKIQSDNEESSTKRARTDSSSRHFEEDRRWQERKIVEEPMVSKTLEHLLHTSCQSPDYVNPGLDAMAPVREIMDTEATHQEDPRLTSRRYFPKTEDDKVILSTVSSRNVDLKLINTATWDIVRVEVPEALQRPPQSVDEVVQTLYMDIDNPITNMSMESGEIQSERTPIDDFVTENFLNDYENEGIRQRDIREQIQSNTTKKQARNIDKTLPIKPMNSKMPSTESNISDRENKGRSSKNIKEQINDTESLLNIESTKYKIPKVKKSDKSIAMQTNPIGTLLNQFCLTTDYVKSSNKLDVDKLYSPDKDNTIQDQFVNQQNIHQSKDQKMFREIVEGDLELSDETSDQAETFSQINIEKTTPQVGRNKNRISQENINEDKVLTQLPIQKSCNVEVDPNKYKTGEDNSNTQARRVSNENTEETILDSKKQKVKKKSQKHKKDAKEASKYVENNVSMDRETRFKKESKPKAKKSNFSDLFGDSSSLITPEDLGIIPAQAEPQSSSKYLPVFEDALDAVDVNVETLNKVQTRSTQVKVDDAAVDSPQSNKMEEKPKSKTKKVKDKIQTKDRQIKDSIESKNKSKKCKDEKPICTSDPKETNFFVNSEAITKEPDIVSTVIISTGVQPQIASDIDTNAPPQAMNNLVQKTETNQTQNEILAKIQQLPMALATSTPHKVLSDVQRETDSHLPESSNSSDKVVRNDVSSSLDQSSAASNEQDDAPDVRIIVVGRRKKVLKKTLST